MKKRNLTSKLFSITCQHGPNVLSKILTAFTRPGYVIKTVSQSVTDLSDMMLVTLEVIIPAAIIDHMINRLNRIVEVFDVTISFGSVLQTALFHVSVNADKKWLWQILLRHHAQVVEIKTNGDILIQQTANEAAVQKLLNELEGKLLNGFSCLPLPVSCPVPWDEFSDKDILPASLFER